MITDITPICFGLDHFYEFDGGVLAQKIDSYSNIKCLLVLFSGTKMVL